MEGKADIGICGVGVMGANLALNLLSKKEFTVAVFDFDVSKNETFVAENKAEHAERLCGASSYEDFKKLLKKPRKVLILVPAGAPTDAAIESLSSVFEADDVIVDTGNAHFKDQTKRAEELEKKGLRFLGMGISGGAEGARKGPAFFPGGTLSVWDEIKPIIESASAKASDGLPCVTMCGSGGAGSCVKMYHNAGEYAILQLWGEAYATMKGAGMNAEEISAELKEWKRRGKLDSYMLDITIEVAGHKDDDGSNVVSKTADMIGSKGTGLWSVQEAMGVGCPVPSLAAAVLARQMSMSRPERQKNYAVLGDATQKGSFSCSDRRRFLEDLYGAVYVAIVASYAQMFQAIRAIDEAFGMDIAERLPRIISTFRAGCILQGQMLQPMYQAFSQNPKIPNLMCAFKDELTTHVEGARAVCAHLTLTGEPAPVMQASLGYAITMCQPVMTAGQVVSLQRDVFGHHGFMLLKDGEVVEKDASGQLFHVSWPEMLP
jgi:6-phosphogluconate dehydrogenase